MNYLYYLNMLNFKTKTHKIYSIFFRIFYPMLLTLLLSSFSNQTIIWVALISPLILVLLVIDISSNIRLDFNSDSITAQTFNSTKIAHTIILSFGILQTFIWDNSILDLLTALAFLFLTLFKGFSIHRSDNFKSLLLRFYLIIALDHFVIFGLNYITFPLIVQLAIPLLGSQILLQLFYFSRS